MAAKKTRTEPEPKVASGKLMRATREEGVILAFPSGNNYRVRMPYVSELLKRGNMPNPLIAFIADAFYSGGSEEKYSAYLKQDGGKEGVTTVVDSLRVICEAMFIEPSIVETPQADNECTIADIPLIDQMWAFRVVFVPAEEVYPFRRQQKTTVERVQRLESVPQAGE